MKLFEQFGLNPDWLKKGSGPMYLRTEQGYSPVDAPLTGVSEESIRYGSPDAKSTIVSVYSTQSSLGEGEPASLLLGRLNIPQSFASQGLYVVRTEVSGMEPYIQKGAFVGVDTLQKHVASGELYGVSLPYEGLVIKRVYVDMQDSRLVLRSEKASYPEVYLPLKGHEAHIVGRVAWVLQRM